MMMIKALLWICWLSFLLCHYEGDGFVPNHGVIVRGVVYNDPRAVDYWEYCGDGSSSALHLFNTRNRIKRVYQSIRNRLSRRKRRKGGEDVDITTISTDSDLLESVGGEDDDTLKFQSPSKSVAASADRKALLAALQRQGQQMGGEFNMKFDKDAIVKSGTKPASTTSLASTVVSALDQIEETPIQLTPPLGLSEGKKTTNGKVVIVGQGGGVDKQNNKVNGSHQEPSRNTLPPTNGDSSIKYEGDEEKKVWTSNNGKANGEAMPFNSGEMITNGDDDNLYRRNGKTSPSTSRKVVNGLPQMVVSSNNDTMSGSTLTAAETVAATTPTMVLEKTEIQPLKQLYTLPPIDRNLTELETEFRDMLEYFCQFTEADLYTIRDPRVRAIMEGVVSGSNEEPVYRAFEVLFEDLLPLRVAGRMIYSKLKTLMLKAQGRAQKEVDNIVEMTGLSPDRVQVSRLAFLTLAISTEQEHYDKEAHLTLEQLVDCGLAEKAMVAIGHDDVDGDLTAFLNRLDRNKNGKVTFSELMAGLQTTAEESCAVVEAEPRCDPADVLQSVVSEMEPTMASTTSKKLDKKRQKYSDRYDSMVSAFQEWDDIVPEGEGRRLDVLRGCFVGAANQRVVEALRVVYLDYAALRLAGNSIFAIMKTLVGTIRKRKSNKH